MVRDAYSAGGQPQQADGSAQPLDIRGSTANLTQELAQLLAQSIAQGQSGKRPLGAAATGSELASLAALVSASQNQRAQPSYKDGLSSLSYARPAQSPAPMPAAVPVSTAAAGMLVNEVHDDEPMPIPSTWRQPMLSDDDRWYRQQLGAAALGLIAGLIVVVPAVLWLSGWLPWGPQPKSAARQQTADQAPVKIAEVKPIKVQRAAADPRPKVEQPPEQALAPLPAARAEPKRSRADELLAQAKQRIEQRDIGGAREILLAAQSIAPGPVAFALAETYDPIMLARWGIGQEEVRADAFKARSLYTRALELGYSDAQRRLDELN